MVCLHVTHIEHKIYMLRGMVGSKFAELVARPVCLYNELCLYIVICIFIVNITGNKICKPTI